MSKKRGKLSTEEEQFIMKHVGDMSVENIANALNRTVKPIEAFCRKKHIIHSSMSADQYEDAALVARLKSMPYWNEVQTQFTTEELNYFVQSWLLLMKQFNEDVLYTEELQMKQWITLEIMGNRVMKNRQVAETNIRRLENILNDLYAVPEGQGRNADRIMHIETELSMQRSSLSAHTTEHTKILEHIKHITKELKGARSDRIKHVEDSKGSFAGFIKALEDEVLRARVGEDMEIMRLAKNNAKRKMSEYHTFADGLVDQPLLTPETVKDQEYE